MGTESDSSWNWGFMNANYRTFRLSFRVILTNQITTHLSRALASQADLVSPADDLSLSEEFHLQCLISIVPVIYTYQISPSESHHEPLVAWRQELLFTFYRWALLAPAV
nr:uncharacterized protein LOC123840343 isoform X2 [Mirounga angustirostris]